jgi:hypothetical protein
MKWRDLTNSNRRGAIHSAQCKTIFADSGALDLDISDIEAQQKFLTDAFLAGERLRTQAQINELRNRGELVRAVELEQETAFNAFRASALATGLTDEAQIRAAFRQQELQFEQQK